MYMSDSEIRDSCRNAVPGKNHARVLADLNGVSLQEMQDKLQSMGLKPIVPIAPRHETKKKKPVAAATVPPSKPKPREKHPWSMAPPSKPAYQKRSSWLHKQARQLYAKGLSDRKIAEAIGVSYRTIYRWRNRSCLPPNGNRKGAIE